MDLINKLLTTNDLKSLLPEILKLESEDLEFMIDLLASESILVNQTLKLNKGNSNIIDLIYFFRKNDKGSKINRFFADLDISKGVETRTDYINAILCEMQNKDVLSLACGSGLEIPSVSANRYDCYDIDSNAIFKLDIRSKKGVKTFCKNVLTTKFSKKYDFIYSAGLFDYFNLELTERTIKRLLLSLKDGGKLLILNADAKCKDQDLMAKLLDWHLIYKSKTELETVAHGLNHKILQDDFGAFNYLEITK
jgi:hypothetical protein